MSERVPLPRLYAETRQRLTEFLLGRPGDWDRPAPATPRWTVHDVLAHLTGAAEDVAAGVRIGFPPGDEWTAGHVARGRDVPVPDLLESWAEQSPAVEAVLGERPIWAMVLDAGSHEQDIRGAVGDTGARDSAVVTVGAKVLLQGLRVPAPLIVRTEREEVRVGPEEGEPVTLTTSTFEAFRWRMGRRSHRQLAAMDWSGDPGPYLGSLCVFGPAESDVVE